MERLIHQQLIACGASTEAIEKLEKYVDLIRQWNKAINLIAPSTLKGIWTRHILDSAQLWPVIQKISPKTDIIDLGSGGGLPGLVLAMLGADHVTMVESDTRKCVFLREVSRETSLSNVTVINDRIENAKNIKASIVTARALAPLPELIAWAQPLLAEEGKMVFLKGKDAAHEVAQLSDPLRAGVLLLDSQTDPAAKVIIV